jgi:hypothetical protein
MLIRKDSLNGVTHDLAPQFRQRISIIKGCLGEIRFG